MVERLIVAWNWIFRNEPDKAEGKVFIFFRFWLQIFESVFVIYGSTFLFGDYVEECEQTAKKAQIDEKLLDSYWKLSVTTKVLMIYGFSIIIYILCQFIIFCVLFKTYQSWVQTDTEQKKAWSTNPSEHKETEQETQQRQKNIDRYERFNR